MQALTHFAIAVPRTWWKTALTCAPCRPFWVMPISLPPRFTRMLRWTISRTSIAIIIQEPGRQGPSRNEAASTDQPGDTEGHECLSRFLASGEKSFHAHPSRLQERTSRVREVPWSRHALERH